MTQRDLNIAPQSMDSKTADSGMRAKALDLGAEKSWDLSRADRNGVCLIPYLTTTLLYTLAFTDISISVQRQPSASPDDPLVRI